MLDFFFFIRYNEVTKNKRENEQRKRLQEQPERQVQTTRNITIYPKRYYEREVRSKENLTAFDFSINQKKKT